MSFNKSFISKMVLIIGLILMVSVFKPIEISGAMVSDLCFGKTDQENCSNTTDRAEEEPSESASSSIGIFDYVKVLFALVLVIGVLVFILKFVNRKTSTYQQNSLMKNLGGLSLGAQKSAQVIQIGNRLYIVGVGDNITLLKEIDNEEEMNQLLAFYNNKQQEFSTTPYIKQLMDKFKGKKEGKVESTSFNELFNTKLNDLKKERSKELEGWKEKEKNDHE